MSIDISYSKVCSDRFMVLQTSPLFHAYKLVVKSVGRQWMDWHRIRKDGAEEEAYTRQWVKNG